MAQMTEAQWRAYLRVRRGERNQCEECLHPISRAHRAADKPWLCARCDRRNKVIVARWAAISASLSA
jgi:hypothetical protein